MFMSIRLWKGIIDRLIRPIGTVYPETWFRRTQEHISGDLGRHASIGGPRRATFTARRLGVGLWRWHVGDVLSIYIVKTAALVAFDQ
jgi:hypothetical protein